MNISVWSVRLRMLDLLKSACILLHFGEGIYDDAGLAGRPTSGLIYLILWAKCLRSWGPDWNETFHRIECGTWIAILIARTPLSPLPGWVRSSFEENCSGNSTVIVISDINIELDCITIFSQAGVTWSRSTATPSRWLRPLCFLRGNVSFYSE